METVIVARDLTNMTMEETNTMVDKTIVMTDPRLITLHLQDLQEETAVISHVDMDTAKCAAQEDKIQSANATTTFWPAASAPEDGTTMTAMTITEMTTEVTMIAEGTTTMVTTEEVITGKISNMSNSSY